MSGLVRLLIKGAVYIFVIIPLVQGIVGGIIGFGGFSVFIGIVVAVGVVVWLEKSGISNNVLNKVFGALANHGSGAANAGQGQPTTGDTSAGRNMFSTGVETSMKCPNCNTLVTLVDGHGKCKACDSAF